jgi:hypothetical protein
MFLTLLTFLTFTATDRVRGRSARTILGWTPGVRSLVGGGVLPCGCLIGIYDTWGSGTITIVDGRGEQCPHDRHRENAVIGV